MSELFASFSRTSKEDWIQLLHKELKGTPPETLQKFNRVEEIAFPSYFHKEDAPPAFSDPGQSPYTRGTQSSGNDWHIGTCFRTTQPAEANREILGALMAGTTSIVLHAETDAPVNFGQVLKDVGLEYVHTTLHAKTEGQAKDFLAFTGNNPSAVVIANTQSWLSFARQTASVPAVRPFCVNAYSVQQAGGTTWQETGIALAEGHELLVQQMEAGLTIDEAAGNIRFLVGIGNKYFFEIAKLRALRTAWTRIVESYQPENPGSGKAVISAQTGFVFTSIKDPYTNLLRQTTEAMSAVVAGTDELIVQPYDWYAHQQQTAFTRRMATNISLLLKEEAYLDKVLDPAGGSYALDDLTNAIAERSWSVFREIEAEGGISNAAVREKQAAAIAEKARQRLQQFAAGEATLIGVNAFPNPETVQNHMTQLPAGWNSLPSLHVESDLEKA